MNILEGGKELEILKELLDIAKVRENRYLKLIDELEAEIVYIKASRGNALDTGRTYVLEIIKLRKQVETLSNPSWIKNTYYNDDAMFGKSEGKEIL